MPAGLAVAEHERLAEGFRVQFSDLLNEDGEGARNVLNPLSFHRQSRKPREVDRVPGSERFTDLARLLEPANSRSLSGTRIDDDDDGAVGVVDLDAFRRNDAQQRVIDRMAQFVATHHKLAVVDQDRSRRMRQHVLVLVAALAQYVQEQNRPLPGVAHILIESCRCQFADLARQFVEFADGGRRQLVDRLDNPSSTRGGGKSCSGIVVVTASAIAPSSWLFMGHEPARSPDADPNLKTGKLELEFRQLLLEFLAPHLARGGLGFSCVALLLLDCCHRGNAPGQLSRWMTRGKR